MQLICKLCMYTVASCTACGAMVGLQWAAMCMRKMWCGAVWLEVLHVLVHSSLLCCAVLCEQYLQACVLAWVG